MTLPHQSIEARLGVLRSSSFRYAQTVPKRPTGTEMRKTRRSMASTVAALLAAGLVSRAPDPGDRRRVLIALTRAGREALAVDRRRREGWLADAIRGDLSPKEQRALADAAVLLARIAESGDTRR